MFRPQFPSKWLSVSWLQKDTNCDYLKANPCITALLGLGRVQKSLVGTSICKEESRPPSVPLLFVPQENLTAKLDWLEEREDCQTVS